MIFFRTRQRVYCYPEGCKGQHKRLKEYWKGRIQGTKERFQQIHGKKICLLLGSNVYTIPW